MRPISAPKPLQTYLLGKQRFSIKVFLKAFSIKAFHKDKRKQKQKRKRKREGGVIGVSAVGAPLLGAKGALNVVPLKIELIFY